VHTEVVRFSKVVTLRTAIGFNKVVAAGSVGPPLAARLGNLI
jgi:hypothetical protein